MEPIITSPNNIDFLIERAKFGDRFFAALVDNIIIRIPLRIAFVFLAPLWKNPYFALFFNSIKNKGIERKRMIKKIPPKKIMYILMCLLVIAVALHVITNNDKYIYGVVLIGGVIGILRPRLILDFFEQEDKRGDSLMKSMFSETIYKIIGFCGGLFLVMVALARLLLNYKI